MTTYHTCECSDPGCPSCSGQCSADATQLLIRVDMDDETGTLFCDDCAADAMESGVFCVKEDDDDDPEGDSNMPECKA